MAMAPSRLYRSAWLVTSYKSIIWSWEQTARVLPSGENLRQSMELIQSFFWSLQSVMVRLQYTCADGQAHSGRVCVVQDLGIAWLCDICAWSRRAKTLNNGEGSILMPNCHRLPIWGEGTRHGHLYRKKNVNINMCCNVKKSLLQTVESA